MRFKAGAFATPSDSECSPATSSPNSGTSWTPGGATRRAHQWGIVAGLALTPTSETVRIEPGVAVDGYGRPLVLQAPIVIPVACLDRIRAGAAAVDIGLLYDQIRATPRQPGHHECGPGRESRWLERPSKRLTTVADEEAPTNPRRPPGVAPDDLPFGPERKAQKTVDGRSTSVG